MKTIVFDMDSIGLEDADGGIPHREHFSTIFKYLSSNKVHIFLRGSWKGMPCGLVEYVTGTFKVGESPPRTPDLIVTSDEDFAKRFSSVFIPPFDPNFNEFAALSLAGNLLDTLKDRVVLGKKTQPTEKIEPEPKKQDKEDVTNYGFSI